MCGIAGIVDFTSSKQVITGQKLKRMSDVVCHRGPDDEGLWISDDKNCGFAFRRLSIVDLSKAGNQPMQTQDRRFTIVYNGEIYNHLELRQELINLGYQYRSKSDTETLLYAYQQWGKDVLNKLLGMWGFAIWDAEKKELFASRDRIGIKPFYFYHQNNKFVFGSEIKSILASNEVKTEINFDELPNYLNLGTTGPYNTLFKGIRKLPPAHYLILKDNELTINRYWHPFINNLDLEQFDEQEIIEMLRKLFEQSVKARMMSDVPFGVFLSGGIDSSLNVAQMSKIMNRPVDTFTVGYKDLEKYNELEYARKIADLFQTNHREILIDQRSAFEILEDLPWYEDEPNGDPVCIPLYFLSKLTRQSGTIVVQVGEGSDEQFFGYSSMLRDYNFYNDYWQSFNKLPKFLKKSFYYLFYPGFRFADFLFSSDILYALEFLRRSSNDEPFYWGGNSVFSVEHQKLIFSRNYFHLVFKPVELIKELYSKIYQIKSNIDTTQLMPFVEFSYRLPEMLLMRVDKIGMAHSIEARVPFLDHRIVEFSFALPKKFKVPNKNITKYILKKSAEGILPKEIIYRKKQGFWAPVNEWIRNDWYDYVYSKIINSFFVKNKIFEEEYLKSLLCNHKNHRKNNGTRLFFLLMLSLWYEKFFK